jgi:hypothetical protein
VFGDKDGDRYWCCHSILPSLTIEKRSLNNNTMMTTDFSSTTDSLSHKRALAVCGFPAKPPRTAERLILSHPTVRPLVIFNLCDFGVELFLPSPLHQSSTIVLSTTLSGQHRVSTLTRDMLLKQESLSDVFLS